MDCKQASQLLSAYMDRELGAATLHEVETHLLECSECQTRLQALQATSEQIKKSATTYQAPSNLRQAVQAEPKRVATRAIQTLAIAVAIFLAWFLGHSQQGGLNESAVVLSHVHALMTDHLTEVLSTDKHTVKPWFNGKTDFSPPVVDLAKQGFPLVGGRLDSLNGKPAAVLVYHRQKHVIDLYITLGPGTSTQTWQSRGYNVLHWGANDFQYWAVSDLNSAELGQFVAFFKGNI